MPDVHTVAYAHSRSGSPRAEWHTLRDHLESTAALARAFAAKWNAGDWGHFAGLWHDLGKFCEAFQRMINADAEAERGRVNHSSAGALRAIEEFGPNGLPLAFVIAGHHAGLPDLQKLRERLEEKEHLAAAVEGGAGAEWLRAEKHPPLSVGFTRTEELELWIRFLFSALIDADRLDTERFHDGSRTASRGGGAPLAELSAKLDAFIDRLSAGARLGRSASRVLAVRESVLADCRRRAADAQGVFTLTVPTGGGKTLASVSFALRHAVRHALDRVIVVIPYTSIIEQNAAVLKDAVGEENVLEHHTNFDPGDQQKYWLDAENWDAPVVVTTSVQFFESLFANRTSVARKVHAIARSVVVFDEVQTLPPDLLKPIVDVLGELVVRYRTSVVLCTATQPALTRRPAFPEGFASAQEIIGEPSRHFAALRRVDVRWPRDLYTPEPWAELAARIAAERSALAVVHLRADARRLCALLQPETIHLSAAMYPEHRTRTLAAIRRRLDARQPCRVVATQLVEAGVDLDFPVVFRALAGLDSLAQAAGRCNREGNLERGVLELFVAETSPPPGPLRRALDAARIVIAKHGGTPDLFADPALYTEYFLQFYQTPDDHRRIQHHRRSLHFAQVAENFRMIEDREESLVIPFEDDARAILRALERGDGSPRLLRRRLQRYTVSVGRRDFQALRAGGAAVETEEGSGIFVLADLHRALYDDRFGLLAAPDASLAPEALIT